MHNNYKHLLFAATLLVAGPSFGQANPAPATNPGVSPKADPTADPTASPAAGRAAKAVPSPTANQAVRRPPRPNSGLKPCESVMVDPPTYLTLGKSRVIKLPFPAARMLLAMEATGATDTGSGAGAGAAPAAPTFVGCPARLDD